MNERVGRLELIAGAIAGKTGELPLWVRRAVIGGRCVEVLTPGLPKEVEIAHGSRIGAEANRVRPYPISWQMTDRCKVGTSSLVSRAFVIE